jgi:hypothetical protein
MPTKDAYVKIVRAFKTKYALDAPDENVIATIHLMNKHRVDSNAALDQSSRSGNDSGIDAWWYAADRQELFIYQSKLSDSRPLAAKGFADLSRAREWVESVLVRGELDRVPNGNHSLFNLFTKLGAIRNDVRRIRFVLISPFERNDLEDLDEFTSCETSFVRTPLREFIQSRDDGRLSLAAEEYALERGIADDVKMYSVERIPQTRIDLRPTAHLDLAYVTLYSLVSLYRQRGDVLFDKNVRLSLSNNKEAKDRLVHPMEQTLDAIVAGRLSPSIFPFYHIGVTIAASASVADDASLLTLEAPSIINGCQTITIAADFLTKLERQKGAEALERFKQIKVIAKVVVGTTSDELKEITNANNRQNPIDNWQLFSNEPVHIEIESALKDVGVFYERQKGKFDSTMKRTETAKNYPFTNGTYIRVVDLAQIVALARGSFPWAAKPSDVFINKESHDKCFDKFVGRDPHDIIFCWNLHKALKRGLNKYLEIPAHANSNAPLIFRKPSIRAHVYSLGLLHFYQNDNRKNARQASSTSLHKIANQKLVEEVQTFCQKIVTKVKNWYTDESNDLTREISKTRVDAYFANLAVELGIDTGGARPFTSSALRLPTDY